jgi:hypothetical protein
MQLDKRCKSFNFSKKLKLCELNSGTKKEFPGNFFVTSLLYFCNTGELRVCVKNRELQFQYERPSTGLYQELQGNMFYRFTDAQKHTDLQVIQ